MMRRFVIFGIVLIVLGAAWMLLKSHAPKNHAPFQTGPLQIEGVLTSTGISLIRRGSHVLTVDGHAAYYLESARLNLDDFEGQTVTASGTVEPNVSDEYLPILIVESLSSLDSHSGNETSFQSLGIAFVVPQTWNVNIEKGVLTARLSGSTIPFLTLRHDEKGVLAESGQTLRIGGRPAGSIQRADGSEEIFVSHDVGVLLLHYVPSDAEDASLRAELDQVLSTVRFLQTPSRSSSSIRTGTGSAILCGGAAGILCPQGFFCEITDHTVNTGRCRQ